MRRAFGLPSATAWVPKEVCHTLCRKWGGVHTVGGGDVGAGLAIAQGALLRPSYSSTLPPPPLMPPGVRASTKPGESWVSVLFSHATAQPCFPGLAWNRVWRGRHDGGTPVSRPVARVLALVHIGGRCRRLFGAQQTVGQQAASHSQHANPHAPPLASRDPSGTFFQHEGATDGRQRVTLSELRAAEGEALLAMVRDGRRALDHIAVGAAFAALGRSQAKSHTRLPPHQLHEAVDTLQSHFLTHCASEYSVRSLTGVVHAMAQLDVGSGRAFVVAEQRALSLMQHHSMTPRALSTLTAAFSKVGYPAHEWFQAAAHSAVAQSAAFTPRDLSTLVWAYASAAHDAPALFAAMHRTAAPRLASFSNQDLSLMLWAYARADSVFGKELIVDAEAHVVDRLPTLSTQHLSNIAWAYGKLGQAGDRRELFSSIRQAALPQLPRFRPQELVMLVWAFARVGQPAPELFSALSQQLLPRVSRLGVHGLAMAVWAFAASEVTAPALFAAVKQAAVSQMSCLSIQNKLMLAWAFAKAGRPAEELFRAISECSPPEQVSMLNQQGLANLAWAYAKAGERSPEVFSAIQAAALASPETLTGFSPHGLAALAWSFARVGQPSEELLSAMLPVAQNRVAEFSAKGLSMLSWAYARSSARLPAVSEPLLDAVQTEVARRMAAAGGVDKESRTPEQVGELAQLAWAHVIASQSTDSPAELAVLQEEVLGRDAVVTSPYYLASLASAYAHVEARSGEPHNAHAEELFDTLYDEATRRLDVFTPSDLANTLWAHVRADTRYVGELLATAEPIIMQRISSFDAPQLGLLVWSYAKAEQSDVDALFALAAHRLLVPDAGLSRLSPAGLATLCWAYSKAEQPAGELFSAVADLTVLRARQFDARTLATTALGFARAGHADDRLFQAIASAAALRAVEFTPQGLATVDRAFKLVGQSGRLHEALRQAAVQRAFRHQ